jgi:hypothetical protein
VKVENIRIWKLLKNGGEKWGVGGKRLRESNGKGSADQSKVDSQWGHIEKPLETTT